MKADLIDLNCIFAQICLAIFAIASSFGIRQLLEGGGKVWSQIKSESGVMVCQNLFSSIFNTREVFYEIATFQSNDFHCMFGDAVL